MPFVLQTPSLEHVAGVRIVTCLWSQRDIFTQIAQLYGPYDAPSEYSAEWKPIEDQVKSKILALPLPQLCKRELLNFVAPLGMEIFCWCTYHRGISNQFIGITLPPPFCWTMHGTVDYTQTAALILKTELLDVEKRYELACISCLEVEAGEWIQRIPVERRQEYINEEERNYFRRHHSIVIEYFTCALSDDVDLLNRRFRARLSRDESINQYLFKFVLSEGSRATCQYFFEKLKPEEKEQILSKFQFRVYPRLTCQTRNCGFMYCLSLMNKEQQRRLFHTNCPDVLKCLISWPMQPWFSAAAECWWSSLNETGCAIVMAGILVKVYLCLRDWDYSRQFWECWRMCSDESKQHFLSYSFTLIFLILTRQEKFIQLILNEAPSHQLLTLFNDIDELGRVLVDESVMSDAALMECKQTALFNSSNAEGDEEKRLRSEHVTRLIDNAMERRNKRAG